MSGTRMFFSSFFQFSSPLLQDYSFFLYFTPSEFETFPLFLSPVLFLCKTCIQSQNYSFPAVVGRNNGAGSHSALSPFLGSVTAAGPAHRLWLTCFIGEMTSLEQTFWRCLPDTLQQQGTVPPSRATQLALENAAWPHSIMPLTLKPNSSLTTLFSLKAACLQAVSMRCSNTPAVLSPHTKNNWEFFSEYPFMLVGAHNHQREWRKLYFYLVQRCPKLKQKSRED